MLNEKPKSTEAETPHKYAKLPNQLTVTRIISIPFLVLGILTVGSTHPGFFGKPAIVLGLFGLAALTDFLDGYLARKWDLVSDFGRMIDPIADKLLVAACLIAIMIVTEGHMMFLIPGLAIIGRDILVSGAREHAALKARAMPPTKLAKWKTACEMLAIALLILWQSLIPLSPPANLESAPLGLGDVSVYLGVLALWVAAVLSVYTGSLYFRASLKD